MKLFDILFESDMRKVSLVVLLQDNKVLILKRSAGGSNALKWGFPGGGIKDGETAKQAAIRECEEEIGITPTKLKKLKVRDNLTWFVGLMPCDPQQCIDLDLNEHTDWAMVDMDNIHDFDTIDGMLEVVEQVLS
jgi:8-oxo-dGTP pyrophosphatase MutT (NUDIX family)